MKILVVDDSPSIRNLTVSIVDEMGHDYLEADSGEAALEIVNQSTDLPDLVILDINMPGIDGYETAKRFKEIAGHQHVPIIFLTGVRDADIQAKCLEYGDDYIAKPFSVEMVILKVKAHLRVSQLSTKMQQKNIELQRHHQMMRTEHEIVENIFSNHFKRHITQSENLRYHISPVSIFNGDILLTAAGPAGNFYIAVGDVTGHGLPAAVAAIPIYSAFRTMAEKGLNIGTIAAEMNRSLRQLMPDNMMMATTIMEVNAGATQLNVWSGGMPPMILEDGKGNIKSFIKSRHTPLAVLKELEFSQAVDIYELNAGDRIFMYTDGVEESRNSAQQMYGEDRLFSLFDGQTSDMFNRIVASLESFTHGTEQDDDITLVELTCQPNADYERKPLDEDNIGHCIPWNLTFSLNPEDMRSAEPIPQIVRLLSNATGVRVHEDFISTILSEFYGNALEHGLLKLDSNMKNDEDGFFAYYQARRDRLAQLEQGSITLSLDYKNTPTGPTIAIKVSDSGDGFDYEALESKDDDSFGRGVNIIEHLCEDVEYSDGGSTVSAIYRLHAQP